MSEEIVFPVVRWGTSVASEHHVGLLRLAILTVQGQTEDQAQETPIFSLSPAQLRELAATFHSYYAAERFLVGDPALARARMALLAATAQVLKNALGVLGVSAPEAMAREAVAVVAEAAQ